MSTVGTSGSLRSLETLLETLMETMVIGLIASFGFIGIRRAIAMGRSANFAEEVQKAKRKVMQAKSSSLFSSQNSGEGVNSLKNQAAVADIELMVVNNPILSVPDSTPQPHTRTF